MFKPIEITTPKSKSFADYTPASGQPGGGIDSETGELVTPVAAPPEPAMFGPADRVAPAPDPAMFGPPVDRVAPAPDPANSPKPLYTQAEIETPRSEGNEEAGDGRPGHGVLSSRSASVNYGPMPQKQTVTNDRGGVTEFTSDVPIDRKAYGR
jgi:hypothetical protein